MKRNKLCFPLLLPVVLLLACLGRRTEPAPTMEPLRRTNRTARTVIRFAAYEWEHQRYGDLVQAFEADNPGVEVRLVSIDEVLKLGREDRSWPDDAWVRLASAADVIKMQSWDADVEPALLYDLAPLIEADPTFGLEDFYPGALTGCRDPGGIWCLPSMLHGYLFFYDKDAFDRAGVSYPEPGWTWDDLMAKAAALTERKGDRVERWGVVLSSSAHLPLIESQVGSLVDMATDPPTLRFDQPEVVQTVRWHVDLGLEHGVARYLRDEEAALEENLIAKGNAAMWLYQYGAWSHVSEQRNVGVAPFPVRGTSRDVERGTTPFWGHDRFAISAGTAHPDIAWRWIKTFSETAGKGALVPARRSIAEGSGFWDRADPELASALRYAVEHSYGTRWSSGAYPALRQAPGYSAFFAALEAVLSGEKSAEIALAEAQTEAKAAIQDEMERRAQASPVPTVVVAAPESHPIGPDTEAITFSSAAFRSIQPNALQPYRELVGVFQKTHPGIVIEVELPPSPSQLTMEDVAQGVDCFSWSPAFHEQGSLETILSLEPFLETDPSFSTEDFYPSLLEPFVRQGQLWGLPSQARPDVIKYNRDLFDAARLDYPAVDWTTDDFLQAAIALTSGEGEEKQYGFVGSPFEYTLLWMLERRGADLVDSRVDPPTMVLDDPQTVEAMRWYVDLSAVYGVKPVFMTDVTEMSERFQTVYTEWTALVGGGRAGMWTLVESLDLVHDPQGLNVGLATIPARPGDAAGAYQYVYGYFISVGTDAAQACWEWITFLTGQSEAVWGVPARRSVAESEAYRQMVGAERAAVYVASVAGANRAPSYQLTEDQAWMAPGMLWLIRAYGQAIEGQAAVEGALAAAQQIFDDYRACVVMRGVELDQQGWAACMREADPSLPEGMFGG